MIALDPLLIIHLKEIIKQLGFSSNDILNIEAILGGSINRTYCLITEEKKFFIKLNNSTTYPELFEKEQKGLLLLRNSNCGLFFPNPLYVGQIGEKTFFLMDYIDSSNPNQNFWSDFGHGLARLHRNSQPNFGLDHDNYIGSLIQLNNKKEKWTDFFVVERLMVQEKLAVDQGLLDKQTQINLEKLYAKVDQLFPDEPPALLHGDLWSGNFMASGEGNPCIFDPAVYYGHREMDIAMTHLFGGFAPKFYDAYQEVYPLENNWEQRIELCNLYPLLVHVNLFGSSYALRVKNILRRIVG